MSGPLAQEAAARLFRSVRAGRLWLRSRESMGEVSEVAGCVTMKRGNNERPVFMIPGAPGSILQLGPIAAALTVPMPVYAVKPRGLEEGETPCERIEEMAEYSIGVMRAVQATGPYLLIGYSAGGLVALDIARQLSAAGDEVPLVVLLDTDPSKKIWPFRCHIEILLRQTIKRIWELRRYTPSQSIHYVSDWTRSLLWYLATSGVKLVATPPIIPEGVSAASRRVHQASVNAGEDYRPSHYSGKVVFVQPDEVPNLEPRDPAQVWRRFLSDLEVRRVPGSHMVMVETGAAETAAEISQCLAHAGLAPPRRSGIECGVKS